MSDTPFGHEPIEKTAATYERVMLDQWVSAEPPGSLPDFLLARYAEEERDAEENRGTFPGGSVHDDGALAINVSHAGNSVITWYRHPVEGYGDMASLRRWLEPRGEGWHRRRVLDDIEAKRRIVNRCAPLANMEVRRQTRTLAGDTLRFLALPYADHPDYREEWKP